MLHCHLTVVILLFLTYQVHSTDYLINNPGCQIKDYPLFSKEFRRPKPEPEPTRKDVHFVRQIGNFQFEINLEYVVCCYSYLFPVERSLHSNNLDDFVFMKESEECQTVRQTVVWVYAERVRFKCFIIKSAKVKNYLFYNIPKSRVLTKIQQREQVRNISVLILGVDSTSRLSFHRFMPKTTNLLTKLHAVEFLGYNRIGDNSFPNLYGLLVAVNDWEPRDLKCMKEYYFDDCPLIWKPFDNASYVTAFAEDQSRAGLFTFNKRKGFRHSTVDYDFRVWDHYNSNAALVRNWQLYQLVRLFAIDTFKDTPYFFYAWSTALSHDDFGGLKAVDNDYYRLVKDLNNTGSLDNAMLIFISDHGYRGRTEIRSSVVEKNLPTLFIRMPKSFRKQYPQAYQNLHENKNKLVTVRDVHATMLDLLRLDNLKTENHKVPLNAFRTSLFHRISANRTCKMAGIYSKYCACM